MPRRSVFAAAVLAAAAFAFAPTPSYAASIAVTTTVDELSANGACSLREAVRAATTNRRVDSCAAGSATGADTITVPAGTYVLTLAGEDEDAAATGDLDIASRITIRGAGAAATIIDGNNTDRVLDVHAGATLTLANVTVQHGYYYGQAGGIRNAGTVTINRAVLRDTFATQGGGLYTTDSATIEDTTIINNDVEHYGGGIYNTGTLTISRSTLSDNDALDGYGGAMITTGTATLTNITVSNNSGWKEDGTHVGGIHASGTTTIRNSTITNNRGWTGGLNGTATLQNTIIAGNFSLDGTAQDCRGTYTSTGNNLVGTTRDCTLAGDTNNLVNVDAKLGPLQPNGGPTATHALLVGSPAIDAAATCERQDQRGVGRPKDGNGDGVARCDVGAVERRSASSP